MQLHKSCADSWGLREEPSFSLHYLVLRLEWFGWTMLTVLDLRATWTSVPTHPGENTTVCLYTCGMSVYSAQVSLLFAHVTWFP